MLFSPACLYVGRIIDQIFVKCYGLVGHNPGTSQFDFGGNPNLACRSRNIGRNFTIVISAVVMFAHHGFGDSLKIRRLVELNK